MLRPVILSSNRQSIIGGERRTMTCAGGRLESFLKWRAFRPSPVMLTVRRINDRDAAH
jgi:hypothetical protein